MFPHFVRTMPLWVTFADHCAVFAMQHTCCCMAYIRSINFSLILLRTNQQFCITYRNIKMLNNIKHIVYIATVDPLAVVEWDACMDVHIMLLKFHYFFLEILFSSPSILKIIPRVIPGISNLTCIFFCYNCYIIKDRYTLKEQSLNV